MMEFPQEFADEIAALEKLILELPPEYTVFLQTLITEMLETGTMPSLKYVRPTAPLREYIKEAWHVLEPNDFKPSWHTDAICEHLEAVANGQIRNLIINIPPRCSKSMIVSVMFPTWLWSFRPELRFLFASHSDGLVTDHSWNARLLLQSDWYKERWGHVVQLMPDNNQKTRYSNTRKGYRISTSVASKITGFGGDYVVTDDANDLEDIENVNARMKVINWYDRVMSSRLNDINTGHRINIQQRGHMEDLTGHLLKKNPRGWETLILPMEFEVKSRCVTVIGFADPREKEGELLVPARFDEIAVGELKKALGEYSASGQLQQHPAPPGGGMFKRAWFKIVDLPPRKPEAIVRFWDIAGSEEKLGRDPDYTVGTRMSFKDNVYYVEHVVRGRWTAGVVDRTMEQTAMTDGKWVPIREEREGGSAGKAVVAARLLTLAGWDYEDRPPNGSKTVRAKPFAVQAEGGNVVLVKGEWNEEWLDELANFPRAKHDDQVDSAAGAFNELVVLKEGIMIF